MQVHRRFPLRASLLLALVLAAAACDEDAVNAPLVPVTREITVDANSRVYLSLDDTARVVPVTDPATSSAWDLSFLATTVTVNGGAAGPGGAGGFCVCQNGNPTTTELQAMTPASELADFEAVEASAIPASEQFITDQLAPAVSGWYSGSGATAAVVAGRSFIIRRVSATTTLAKMRVVSFSGATATSPGSITIEYAVQSAPGQPFGSDQQATIAVGASPVRFDFETGAVTTSSTDWELTFEGWHIRTNGGVSGTGGMSAVPDNSTPYASITASYAGSVPAQAYRSDGFSGVFQASPWYRYNITGTDNQIWPTFQVYLLRRGTEVFKVQLTGYYGSNGAPRQITVRYARLSR